MAIQAYMMLNLQFCHFNIQDILRTLGNQKFIVCFHQCLYFWVVMNRLFSRALFPFVKSRIRRFNEVQPARKTQVAHL